MRGLVAGVVGLVLAGPALAQTDDRVLNDVFAVLKGKAILERTRDLCRDYADTDLEADLAGWAERNAGTLRIAEGLLASRQGVPEGALDAVGEDAAAEAGASFARERDRPVFCEQIGETIDGGHVDLATWFPAETKRMADAAEGKWPPIDPTGARPVAEAMEVKQIFFAMADGLVRCGVLFPPTAPYESASSEWEARNSYTRDLADRVLKNWGALHPQRWADARDEAGSRMDAIFADKAGAEAYCRKTAEQAVSGELDIDQQRPELFESVLTNAEIMP